MNQVLSIIVQNQKVIEGIINMKEHSSDTKEQEYQTRYRNQFYHFNTSDLEEILACMEDSDRYIHYPRKQKLMTQIRWELLQRGQKQYA